MANPNPVPAVPSGNPLEEIIPVDKRKKVYAVFALIGLLAATVQTAVLLTNTDGHEPMWLKITVVFYNALSALVNGMANANAKAPVA